MSNTRVSFENVNTYSIPEISSFATTYPLVKTFKQLKNVGGGGRQGIYIV